MEIIEILLPSQCTFFVPGCWGEGACVQCGVPVVGLIDRLGHEALVPVLGVVAEPWGAVEGRRPPAHLEPRGSQCQTRIGIGVTSV